jgi:hypothetical protein
VKRGGPIRRSKPLRGVSTNPDRRRRQRAKKAKQMGDDTGLADFIRSKPCAVPGCRQHPSVVCHIRTRGAGHGARDLDGWPNVLPMCQPHHGEQHSVGWDRFEARHAIAAADVAALIAAEWEGSR